MLESIVKVLPEEIANIILTLPTQTVEQLEEIRIRINRPIELIANGKPQFPPYFITPEDAMYILNKIGKFSIYALEEELKRGYITISGGHRVGLAGKVITNNGNVKAIRDVSSFNIRIAKQKIGVASALIPIFIRIDG